MRTIIFREVKLGGLSFLFYFKNDRMGGLRTNFPGRKDFLPPEFWNGGLNSPIAGDLWAACLTLYILVMGTNPYYQTHLMDYISMKKSVEMMPNMEMISPELRSLLSQGMNPSIANRLNIQQILVGDESMID